MRLKDGTLADLSSLTANTSVACPHHSDEHPSAFIVRSSQGFNGVHCMACNATFWTHGSDPYDFAAFDKLVEDRKAQDLVRTKTVEEDENPFVSFFPPDPSVLVYQSKFLPLLDYREGITVIKSPKGSGKTEALSAMVEQIREGVFSSAVDRKVRPKSVLLIGHRQ